MRVIQPLRTVLPGNRQSGEGYLEHDLAVLLSSRGLTSVLGWVLFTEPR